MSELCPPIGQSTSDDSDGSSFPQHKFYPMPFEVTEENLENYEPGGYHPIALNDIFCDGRYKIVHKLGYGGFSTTWIAYDLYENQHVALKVVVSGKSEDYKDYEIVKSLPKQLHDDQTIGSPIIGFNDTFWHQGPNGRHLCLVSKLLGPSLSHLSKRFCRLYPRSAREVLYKATQGLAFLHSQGICHGDFTPSNILLQLSEDVNQLSVEELYATIEYPQKHDVERYDGEKLGSHDPPYVVQAVTWRDNPQARMITSDIQIIDFDQSFRLEEPPQHLLGSPAAYLSPEAVFELSASPASDIWALGCLIFRVRAGYDIFGSFEGSPSEAMNQVARVIGQFPESWISVRFDHDDGLPINTDDEDIEGSPLEIDPLVEPLRGKVYEITDVGVDRPLSDGDAVGRNDLFWIADVEHASEDEEDNLQNEKHEWQSKITVTEAGLLEDLLSQIFNYDPRKRPSANEILHHPWFDDVRNDTSSRTDSQ